MLRQTSLHVSLVQLIGRLPWPPSRANGHGDDQKCILTGSS